MIQFQTSEQHLSYLSHLPAGPNPKPAQSRAPASPRRHTTAPLGFLPIPIQTAHSRETSFGQAAAPAKREGRGGGRMVRLQPRCRNLIVIMLRGGSAMLLMECRRRSSIRCSDWRHSVRSALAVAKSPAGPGRGAVVSTLGCSLAGYGTRESSRYAVRVGLDRVPPCRAFERMPRGCVLRLQGLRDGARRYERVGFGGFAPATRSGGLLPVLTAVVWTASNIIKSRTGHRPPRILLRHW